VPPAWEICSRNALGQVHIGKHASRVNLSGVHLSAPTLHLALHLPGCDLQSCTCLGHGFTGSACLYCHGSCIRLSGVLSITACVLLSVVATDQVAQPQHERFTGLCDVTCLVRTSCMCSVLQRGASTSPMHRRQLQTSCPCRMHQNMQKQAIMTWATLSEIRAAWLHKLRPMSQRGRPGSMRCCYTAATTTAF